MQNKNGVVVVGSLNVDLVVRVQRVPEPGETLLGSEFTRCLGGKGANQAVAAAKLGAPVAMIGRVGNDMFGSDQLQSLSGCGIDTRAVMSDSNVSTGVAVIYVEESTGQNRITVVPGANNRLVPEDVTAWHSLFANAGVVVAQLEVPIPVVTRAAQMTKESGALFILNPAPAPLQPLPVDLLSCVDVIIPNEHEAEAITGVSVADEAGARRAAAVLQNSGVKSVIITLGGRGLYCLHCGAESFIPAHKVHVVDTVAAGDAFTGALAVALAEGKPMEEATVFANAAAAVTVTRQGAQASLPDRAEVRALLRW